MSVMEIKQDQSMIKVTVTISSPFGEFKISSGESAILDSSEREEERKIPVYEAPKTSKPFGSDVWFEGGVSYFTPATSG